VFARCGRATVIVLWRAVLLAAALLRWVERVSGLFDKEGPRLVAAPVRTRTVGIPAREARSARPTPARSGLRALPYSLRLSVSAVKRSRARKRAENQDSNLEAVPA